MFIDSHCHINFPDLRNNIRSILKNMETNKITNALCVSVTLDDFPGVLELADQYDNIFASVGVHPDYEDIKEPSVDQLVSLSKHSNVVAIGETGLDYFRLKGDLTWQRERFRIHIRSAIKSGLPLIIHTRSAQEDTISIMKDEGANEAGGVMHCFTETYDMAKKSNRSKLLYFFFRHYYI